MAESTSFERFTLAVGVMGGELRLPGEPRRSGGTFGALETDGTPFACIVSMTADEAGDDCRKISAVFKEKTPLSGRCACGGERVASRDVAGLLDEYASWRVSCNRYVRFLGCSYIYTTMALISPRKTSPIRNKQQTAYSSRSPATSRDATRSPPQAQRPLRGVFSLKTADILRQSSPASSAVIDTMQAKGVPSVSSAPKVPPLRLGSPGKRSSPPITPTASVNLSKLVDSAINQTPPSTLIPAITPRGSAAGVTPLSARGSTTDSAYAITRAAAARKLQQTGARMPSPRKSTSTATSSVPSRESVSSPRKPRLPAGLTNSLALSKPARAELSDSSTSTPTAQSVAASVAVPSTVTQLRRISQDSSVPRLDAATSATTSAEKHISASIAHSEQTIAALTIANGELRDRIVLAETELQVFHSSRASAEPDVRDELAQKTLEVKKLQVAINAAEARLQQFERQFAGESPRRLQQRLVTVDAELSRLRAENEALSQRVFAADTVRAKAEVAVTTQQQAITMLNDELTAAVSRSDQLDKKLRAVQAEAKAQPARPVPSSGFKRSQSAVRSKESAYSDVRIDQLLHQIHTLKAHIEAHPPSADLEARNAALVLQLATRDQTLMHIREEMSELQASLQNAHKQSQEAHAEVGRHRLVILDKEALIRKQQAQLAGPLSESRAPPSSASAGLVDAAQLAAATVPLQTKIKQLTAELATAAATVDKTQAALADAQTRDIAQKATLDQLHKKCDDALERAASAEKRAAAFGSQAAKSESQVAQLEANLRSMGADVVVRQQEAEVAAWKDRVESLLRTAPANGTIATESSELRQRLSEQVNTEQKVLKLAIADLDAITQDTDAVIAQMLRSNVELQQGKVTALEEQLASVGSANRESDLVRLRSEIDRLSTKQ
eukprot:TRINITY_DN1694_c0_g2_i2.p1 TRINITY_DN1694_c0_g2~~TRINITY_DN1694_c0_g2_i2.p1  ORF type:complete len:901 (-),score=229.20 TRINITY_DN1694_c0_g2_i2:221-2923(-)